MRPKFVLAVDMKKVADQWSCFDVWFDRDLISIYNHPDSIHVVFGKKKPSALFVDGERVVEK